MTLRAKCLIVVLLFASTAHAQEKFNFGLRAGTNGVASALTYRKGNDGDTSTDMREWWNGDTAATEGPRRDSRLPGTTIRGSSPLDTSRWQDSGVGFDSQPRAPKFGFNEYALLAANAADLGTTIYALNSGAHEANPMLGSKLVTIIPLKVVSTYLQVHAVHKLKSEGHPTAARVLSVVISGAIGSLAVHNVMVATR